MGEPQPQDVQFAVEAANAGSQDFGRDWIAYALATEAPAFVGGVDHSLNPAAPAPGADSGEAYA